MIVQRDTMSGNCGDSESKVHESELSFQLITSPKNIHQNILQVPQELEGVFFPF